MYLSDRKNFIYYGEFESKRWKKSTVHLESNWAWEREETARPELPSLPGSSPLQPWCVSIQMDHSSVEPSNQHCKSCHSHSSEGRCQCFHQFPIFPSHCWSSRLMAQVGWSVRLLEGICSSLGSIIQRENRLIFPFFIPELLLLTEWSHLNFAGVVYYFLLFVTVSQFFSPYETHPNMSVLELLGVKELEAVSLSQAWALQCIFIRKSRPSRVLPLFSYGSHHELLWKCRNWILAS